MVFHTFFLPFVSKQKAIAPGNNMQKMEYKSLKKRLQSPVMILDTTMLLKDAKVSFQINNFSDKTFRLINNDHETNWGHPLRDTWHNFHL